MKLFAAALFAISGLLTGCEAVSNAAADVREKIAGRDEGKTRTFAAASRPTYEAVRTAATQMGYRFVRGGPAQGEFEAVSGLSSGDTLRSARQITMKVHLHASDDEHTDVKVVLTEVLEDNSSSRAGQGTAAPLRDTPQYEVFFRELQKALTAKSRSLTN